MTKNYKKSQNITMIRITVKGDPDFFIAKHSLKL